MVFGIFSNAVKLRSQGCFSDRIVLVLEGLSWSGLGLAGPLILGS